MKNLSGLRMLIAALIIMGMALAAQAGDWAMFGHDAAHTGVADEMVEPPLKLLWKYNAYVSPVVSGDIVYSGGNYSVYAIDTSSGDLKWEYKAPTGTSSPAVSGGMVFVGTDTDVNFQGVDKNGKTISESMGYIYALDASTGRFIWKYKTVRGVSSPVISAGILYACDEYRNVYALDARTGILKWKSDSLGAKFYESSPAVSGGIVYAGSDGLNALDAETGALKWKYTTKDEIRTPSVSGGMVFFVGLNSTTDSNVYALDAMTGALKWKYKTNGGDSLSIYEGVVYGGGKSDTIYALDASTGNLVWKYQSNVSTVFSTNPSVSGGVIYVGSYWGYEGYLFALNESTGTFKWKYHTTSTNFDINIHAYDLVISGGKIYATSGSQLYTFIPGIASEGLDTPSSNANQYLVGGGILGVIAIGIVVYSKRRRGRVPKPASEPLERVGLDLLDAGHVLSKEASSLFNKKDYDSALEKYGEALDKFLMALKSAEDDASLAKSIKNNIISSRKNILACKYAIGISISENAQIAFEKERFEDSELLYNKALKLFEKALEDTEGLKDTEQINKIQMLIRKIRGNLESCHIAIDKIKVEELYVQADKLFKEAIKFREKNELSRASDILKKTENIIEEAFGIAANQEEFKEAQQNLNRFIKRVREQKNIVGDLRSKPIETVKGDERSIKEIKSSKKPDIKSPLEEKLLESDDLEITRSYEVLENKDMRFGILVTNRSNYTVNDVDVHLKYDRSLFSLKGKEVFSLGNITKNNPKTADYFLMPLVGCVHNSKISAIVSYKDASDNSLTVQMRPKEVHCISPFLAEKPMTEEQFSKLYESHSCHVEGIVFKGISPDAVTNFIVDSAKNKRYVVKNSFMNGIHIIYLSSVAKDKTFYLNTVIIKSENSLTHVGLRACSNNEGGINNFINEILTSLRHYVTSVQSAREVENVINNVSLQIINSEVHGGVSIGGDAFGRDESFNQELRR